MCLFLTSCLSQKDRVFWYSIVIWLQQPNFGHGILSVHPNLAIKFWLSFRFWPSNFSLQIWHPIIYLNKNILAVHQFLAIQLALWHSIIYQTGTVKYIIKYYSKTVHSDKSHNNVYLLVCQLPCTAKVQKSYARYKIIMPARLVQKCFKTSILYKSKPHTTWWS